jgi:hypothetical protein
MTYAAYSPIETGTLDLYLKSISGYRSGIRSAVRGLWTGVFDFFEFMDAMITVINWHFPRAWAEGMAAVGLKYPDDITLDEQLALNRAIITELAFIEGFGDAIEKGSKANGGKLTPLFLRAEKWVGRYNQLVNQAMQMAKNDPALMWVRHALDSCSSCIRLDGQTRRASTWLSHDLRPQSGRLECVRSARGIPVCRCEFLPTTNPLTRGRLPNI